jgi:hypothetical protein
MTRRVLALACLVGLSPVVAAAQPQQIVVLKTASRSPLPYPVNGIVTLTLKSGAFIKLPAGYIDYERTAAYHDRAVVKADTARVMNDPSSGHGYWNMTFGPHFVATAWVEDVDQDEMNNGLPTYAKIEAVKPGLTLRNYQRLRTGMTFNEVTAILGGGADLKASSTAGDSSSELYQWTDEGIVVTIMFSDDKLSTMSEVGLR